MKSLVIFRASALALCLFGAGCGSSAPESAPLSTSELESQSADPPAPPPTLPPATLSAGGDDPSDLLLPVHVE